MRADGGFPLAILSSYLSGSPSMGRQATQLLEYEHCSSIALTAQSAIKLKIVLN
jgi:phage major head subunit gpT-like protein